MSENKEIISYHTFMFPFRIRTRNNKEFSLKSIKNDICDKWNYSEFDIDGENIISTDDQGIEKTIQNYNEWKYFYKPVQEVIYNKKSNIDKENEIPISYYFGYRGIDEQSETHYSIELKSGKKYNLNLVGLAFRAFETGMGIISFNLENFNYHDFEDIKLINEYGRRLYPQMYPIEKAKDIFLADKLEILFKDTNNNITENFKKYETGKKLQLPNLILKLFPEHFFNSYEIMPLIDDRMFILCWYGNTLLSKELSEYKDNKYVYLSSSKWSEYLFIDGKGNSCQNKTMLKKLLEKHSYGRWIDYGTLYGISKYSFVCLSDNYKSLEKENSEYIVNHIRTMYYQLITICLMQRATILNFKHRITEIISNKKTNYLEIKGIQRDYLKFINSMCFREITAQEQGIELYNMAKDIMGIDEALKELENEINELNSFYSLEENEKLAKESEKSTKNSENLAVLAGVFLVPTLLLTILGNNIFKEHSWFDNEWKLVWFAVIIPMIISFYVIKFYPKLKLEFIVKKIDKIAFLILIFIVYILAIA